MKKNKDKNKDKEPASPEPQKIPQVHDLSSRVPDMSDAELATFLANAKRLQASGSAIQKKSAEVLVPLIDEEMARRLAAKEAAKAAKRKKPKAKAAEGEPAPVVDEVSQS
ncbi:MAG: hypothetical protein ABL973_20825 [Micropepsaceae bacterium]